MHSSPFQKSVGLVLCLLAKNLIYSSALIVAPPRPQPISSVPINTHGAVVEHSTGMNGWASTNTNNNDMDNFSDNNNNNKVAIARIRSTKRTDLDPIADLLSMAISGETMEAENWKARVERLRLQSSIRHLLDLRVRAMEEGKHYFRQQQQQQQQQSMTATTTTTTTTNDHYISLQELWVRSDSFRHKIEQAAELSSEPHPWEHHDFNYAPEDPYWLRHEMILAQDIVTGEIIGFCEIAMLLSPPSKASQDDDGNNIDFPYAEDYFNPGDLYGSSVECAPTIANLVVSPTWRRRGVAKGLMKSAERIVARKWKCSELGLYVEKANQRAKELYARTGYEVVPSFVDEKYHTATKWYMSKSLLV